ncbi:MAG: RHS repeat-associated core domain-containing protein [Myxococcota bacterium]|nr:RHS repeat-associated core domain-containing protein [Myxococcota bacterium]
MAGSRDHQRPADVAFRYGSVNAMGGNLLVPRVDLSIDTLIGTLEVGAVFNSATRAWTWSFDETYEKDTFTDATGAAHTDLDDLVEGAAIAGTTWVKGAELRIKSKAGLTRHFHGGSGRLRWMYWGEIGETFYPRLNFSEQAIAGQKRIVAVIQCVSVIACQDVISISYDSTGQVVAIDDVAGRRAEFEWSGSELVNAKDGLDVEEGRAGFSYEYDFSGLLTAITNGEGERTEIDYSSGQVAEVKDIGEGDPTRTFFYEDKIDGFYTTRYWDPLGYEHRYVFDGLHRLHQLENVALGESTLWAYGSSLRPIAMTVNTGATTHYTWSGDDLVTEVQPSGNVVQYTYEPAAIDRPTEVTSRFDSNQANPGHRPFLKVEDSIGLVEERAYDSTGRLVSVSNGAGETVSFEYDPNGYTYKGQISKVTGPSGGELSLGGYGWHGHARSASAIGVFLSEQTRAFDPVGNRLTGARIGSPEQGGVTGRSYDADRNVRTISLEGSESISIDVRSDGKVTGIQRPGGDDHMMAYDALGRLTSRSERVDGQWQAGTFEYDAKSQRTALEYSNGMRRELQYDAAGRVTAVTNLRSGVPESTASMTYVNGLLLSKYDSVRNGVEWYLYDGARRVSSVTHEDSSITTITYDVRSRTTGKGYLTGTSLVRSIGYAYDLANRETEIWDGISQIIGRTFEEGRLSQISYGNGLIRAFEYGASGELLGTQTVDSSQALVESTTITRSAAQLMPQLDVTTTTFAGVSATTEESYQMSSLHNGAGFVHNQQLVSWADAQGTAPISYDAKSNILSEGATTFSYNAEGNRLLLATPSGALPISYTYDDAGYTTSRDGKPITWTAHGRMASHGANLFEWDAFGAPVSATVDGGMTRWLFGGDVLGDAAGSPAQIQMDDVSIDLGAGSHLYRHYDFRGNVKFTSDDAGAVEAHYAYSAYGLEAVYGSDDDNVRFAGRIEIGDLMLLGARVYDPASGRFLSQDPVFQLVNQYSYTLGNPIWWWDPDGTQSEQSGGWDCQAIGNAAGWAALAGAGIAIFWPSVGLAIVVWVLAVISYAFSCNESCEPLRDVRESVFDSLREGEAGKDALKDAPWLLASTTNHHVLREWARLLFQRPQEGAT